MTASTFVLPSVTVMGVLGATGFENVHIAASAIPTDTWEATYEPKGDPRQFEDLTRAMGFDSHTTFWQFEDFERSHSCDRLVTVAELARGFLAEDTSDEVIIKNGMNLLAQAEDDLSNGERLDEAKEWDWFTSAGVFTNLYGDEGRSLVVMQAVGKAPMSIGETGATSPSIDAQMKAHALLGGAKTLYSNVVKGHNDGYIKLWGSVDEMLEVFEKREIFSIAEGPLGIDDEHQLYIHDQTKFRETMDVLVRNSVFNPNAEVRDAARWIIWEASQMLGVPSSSIHDLYMARGEGKWEGITVPAKNLRGLTYDEARTAFRGLKAIDAGVAIFEIAKSEIGYTDQRPAEYAATILAAAIAEGWEGPVFLQGDHFQVGLKDYKADPKAAVESVKDLIREAVEAGFYNIDIDTSTLVDLSKETVEEQQRANYEVAAELTKLIREIEPEGMTISVGGEIGEIGTGNSTAEELRAFMDGYYEALGPEDVGISKISIQTGTSHGGVPLEDGTIAKAKIDFDVIEELGEIAREEYGIGGVVQHGASTLPDEAFHHFRERGAIEVHLATGFQNVKYDSEHFPAALMDRVLASIRPEVDAALKKAADAGKDLTEAQAIYKLRKKGFGPHKRDMWSLPLEIRTEIMAELAVKFGMLFAELGVADTRELVETFVGMVGIHRPFGSTIAEVEIKEDDNPNAD